MEPGVGGHIGGGNQFVEFRTGSKQNSLFENCVKGSGAVDTDAGKGVDDHSTVDVVDGADDTPAFAAGKKDDGAVFEKLQLDPA